MTRDLHILYEYVRMCIRHCHASHIRRCCFLFLSNKRKKEGKKEKKRKTLKKKEGNKRKEKRKEKKRKKRKEKKRKEKKRKEKKKKRKEKHCFTADNWGWAMWVSRIFTTWLKLTQNYETVKLNLDFSYYMMLLVSLFFFEFVFLFLFCLVWFRFICGFLKILFWWNFTTFGCLFKLYLFLFTENYFSFVRVYAFYANDYTLNIKIQSVDAMN